MRDKRGDYNMGKSRGYRKLANRLIVHYGADAVLEALEYNTIDVLVRETLETLHRAGYIPELTDEMVESAVEGVVREFEAHPPKGAKWW